MAQEYWVKREGKMYGPYSGGRLKKLAGEGKISPSDQISADKRSWQLAEMVRGLSLRADKKPQQVAAVTSAPPPLEVAPRTGTASRTHNRRTSSSRYKQRFPQRPSQSRWIVIGATGVAAIGLAVAIAVWLSTPPRESMASKEPAQLDEHVQNAAPPTGKPGITRITAPPSTKQRRPVAPIAVPPARPALTKKSKFPFSLDEVDAAIGKPADTLGGWRRYAAEGWIIFKAKQEGEGLTFWWSRNPQGMFFGAGFLGSDLFTSSERHELTALLDRSGVEQTIGRFIARTETAGGGITLYLLPSGAVTVNNAAPRSQEPKSELTALDLFTQGGRQVDLGNLEIAIQRYKAAIALKPDYAAAYFNIGVAHAALEQHAEAITAGKKVVALKPSWTVAYVNLGIAYGKLGQYPDAISAYKKAIALKPDSPGVYINMANAYASLGRHTNAIAGYKKAIALKPDNPGGYFMLGVVYSDLGRDTDAIVAYKKGIALKPDEARAYYHMGMAYVDLGDSANALRAFEMVVALEPKGKMADLARKFIHAVRGQ